MCHASLLLLIGNEMGHDLPGGQVCGHAQSAYLHRSSMWHAADLPYLCLEVAWQIGRHEALSCIFLDPSDFVANLYLVDESFCMDGQRLELMMFSKSFHNLPNAEKRLQEGDIIMLHDVKVTFCLLKFDDIRAYPCTQPICQHWCLQESLSCAYQVQAHSGKPQLYGKTDRGNRFKYALFRPRPEEDPDIDIPYMSPEV